MRIFERGMSVKPRVIFFDIGQTLATGGDCSARRLLASRLQLTDKETKRVGKLIMTHPATEPASLSAALADVLPRHNPSQVREALQTLWKEQAEGVVELPGATDLIRKLKARGLRIGLISNTWHPSYSGFCRTCPEIISLMDHICLSYRMSCKKPSLDLFRTAVAQSGVPSSYCWMVGDALELDIRPAHEAGMKTIWILRHPEREKPLLAQVLRGECRFPDWTVESLGEIHAVLQNMET